MKRKKGTALILAGVMLLLAAAGFVGYNVTDSMRADKASAAAAAVLLDKIEEVAPSAVTQQPDTEVFTEMRTVEIDGKSYVGLIEIPALDLLLPVMSDWSYENLKNAPCRYAGSCYTNDLVICAHNYPKHFNGLRSIDLGEDVYFITVDDQVFHYVITNRETLQPAESERMKTSDGWELTLFTCYIGGATRCTLRCNLVTD